MAQERHTLLRVLVPALFVLGAIGLAFAVAVNSARGPGSASGSAKGQPAAAQAPAGTPAEAVNAPSSSPATSAEAAAKGTGDGAALAVKPADGPKEAQATGDSANPGSLGSAAPTAAPPAEKSPGAGLRAVVWTPEQAGLPYASLGGLSPAASGNAMRMELKFSPNGAGLESLVLAEHFTRIGPNPPHEVLQQAERHLVELTDGTTLERTLVPMALLGVTIDGQFVNLAVAPGGTLWKQTGPGAFEARIVDEQGRGVAEVSRRYRLREGGYDLTIEQNLKNLTDRALRVGWLQFGPVDLPMGVIRYGGDVRRLRLGYLASATSDPDQQVVLGGDRHMIAHASALGTAAFDATKGWKFPEYTAWPDERSVRDGQSLAWAALTNRYFAVAVHPIPERQAPRQDTPTKGAPDKRFNLAAKVDRVVLDRGGADRTEVTKNAVMALRLTSVESSVAPGGTTDASMGVYAGPMSRAFTDAEPTIKGMGLGELVIFTFGGPCAVCTFQSVAWLLRGYLGALHNYVVFDWAIAIILLVITVRTLLHPVTRWSQVNLARFSKQMAALAPKQAKLKEKYGHDPKVFREEVAKLMREENVNYAGALGCLPMFLQMPVWIALYAMIFFTFELRHEAAFFGFFQWASGLMGTYWPFMGDLAEPDHFIPLGISFNVPLLSTLMGPVEAINILPIVMGVVFYIQQKYMTPMNTATMTPEQEMQMKISKVMIVGMFPLMMFNAPAALSLYFMTNSIGGILESKWIRKQIDREDAERERLKAEGKLPVRPTRGREGEEKAQPGLLERIRLAIEAKQKEAERLRAEAQKRSQRKP